MSDRYNFAQWWHLLSLDAPTVAVLWSWLFARAMHLHMPLLAILLLATATWLLYVADRILDGLHDGRTELRERHVFHARHRWAFVVTALILAVLLVWMVFTRMYPQTLKDNLFLSVFALLYFFFVHAKSRFGAYFLLLCPSHWVPGKQSLLGREERPGAAFLGKKLRAGLSSGLNSRENCSSRVRRFGWLPKELAVGVIFAAATAIPAWSRMSKYPGAAKARLAQAVILFAVLCWVNCVAIEKWEAGRPVSLRSSTFTAAHPSTRWAGAHLQSIVSAIALSSVTGAWLARSSGLGEIYLAAFLSSSLLLALDARRSLFSPLSLRIAADAALLTPLAIFPILK